MASNLNPYPNSRQAMVAARELQVSPHKASPTSSNNNSNTPVWLFGPPYSLTPIKEDAKHTIQIIMYSEELWTFTEAKSSLCNKKGRKKGHEHAAMNETFRSDDCAGGMGRYIATVARQGLDLKAAHFASFRELSDS